MTNVVPCWDRVLLEVIPSDTVSEGGIYLPEKSDSNQCEGYIISVGEGSEDTEKLRESLPEGGRVIYQKNICAKVKSEGKEYHIVSVRDIIGVIKEK